MQEGGAPIKYNTDGTIAIASQPREVRGLTAIRKPAALKNEFLTYLQDKQELSLTLLYSINCVSVVPDILLLLPLLTAVLCDVFKKFLKF